MPSEEGYISASELAEFQFCRRAWHLSSLGTPSEEEELTAEREAEREWHHWHADQVAAAARSGSLAGAFAAVFFLLLLLLLLVLFRILAS